LLFDPLSNPTLSAVLSDSRPERQPRGRLHDPPDWASDDATFFITINCQARGREQLTLPGLPEKLFSTVSFYHDHGKWFPEMFLLMPDHLHALISFDWSPDAGLRNTLENWKRYTATHFGISWQRDYFDHRIRSETDHGEKWAYIRDNPVRSGLVERYAEWPHVWFPKRLGW
jgi:putative transposase